MASRGQLYIEIADVLREEIRNGFYSDTMIMEKELQKRFEVSASTVKMALVVLAKENLITRIPGRGTFARQSGPSTVLEEPLAPGKRIKTGLVGVLLPTMRGPVFNHLLYGILAEAPDHGMNPVIGLTSSNTQRETELIARFHQLNVDGLLLWPAEGEQYNDMLLQLHMSSFPMVLVDRWLPGLNISRVTADHRSGAREAVRYLFELGHKKIAFLSVGSKYPDYTQSVNERFLGFLDAYRETDGVLGGSVRWVRPYGAGEKMKEHIGWIAERLQEDREVTAVLCVETYDLECVRRAAEGLGLTIPEDLSAIGFDGGSGETDRMKGWTTYFGDKQWTWIDQSEEQIGREAVRLLHDLIESKSEVRQVMIPAKLCPGDSVGYPNTARTHGIGSKPEGEQSSVVSSAEERG